MKQLSFALLWVLPLATTTTFAQKTVFSLEGHTFYKSGIVRLFNYTLRSQYIPFDSAVIKNGTFYISDTVDEPKLFLLEYGQRSKSLFLGNEQVVLNETDSVSGEVIIRLYIIDPRGNMIAKNINGNILIEKLGSILSKNNNQY